MTSSFSIGRHLMIFTRSVVCSTIIVLFLAVTASAQLGEPDFPKNPVSLGKADYSWPLKNLDGTNFDLGRARGKVLFINIWATWCPPCIYEMPGLEKLFLSMKEEVAKGEIVFIFVSDENSEMVSDFLASKNYKMPSVLTKRSDVPNVFWNRGIPVTFIVSPGGDIVYRHLGAADYSTKKTLEFLRELRR